LKNRGSRPPPAARRESTGSDAEARAAGATLSSMREHRRAQTWIGRQIWPTAGDELREALVNVAPRLFAAFNEHCRLVFDRTLDANTRKTALRRLQEALSHLTPQGRPRDLVEMDVARDWPAIGRMREQFLALAQHDGGKLDADAAGDVVAWVRAALEGDAAARKVVNALAPIFLQNPLALTLKAQADVLTQLACIERPSSVVAFATAILTVKYACGVRAVQRALRSMRDQSPRRAQAPGLARSSSAAKKPHR
jgi:hypothetical protein